MILLTGATGFVGGYVANRLIEAGWEVRAVVRNASRASAFLRGYCSLFEGDLVEEKSAAAAVEGVEGILHLAGIIRERKGQTFEGVHLQATKNLLSAAREYQAKRFLYMSALGSSPESTDLFHKTRWQAEAAVRNSGLAYTIFRPSLIFGENDRFIDLLIKMVRLLPALPHFGWGKAQPIWVEDVADCFVRALNNPSTVGRTFDLGGAEVYSIDDMIDLICRILKINKPRLGAPQWLLWAGARMLELAPGVTPSREQMQMWGVESTGDIGAMMGAFGLTPRPLEDYLRRHIRSLDEVAE